MRVKLIGSLLSLSLSACISKQGVAAQTPEEKAAAPAVSAEAPAASSPVSSPAPSATTKESTPETPPPIVIPENVAVKKTEKSDFIQIADLCEKSLSRFDGKFDSKVLKAACQKVQVLNGCGSVEGTAIYHYDKTGDSKKASKILVFSLIHGDETPAGSVGRFWMERLETIVPRNHWRVVPVLNPDGVRRKTRTNANKVDVNRNFPTQDWTEKAHTYWQRDSKSNPRRFPGNVAASEPETQCALKHIQDFKPDFIVSIHTPLKVLDYDGPKVKPPKFDYLPWKSLGHYPGSLGRYMWSERQVPVLTMELKEDLPANNKPWLQLQDVIGVLVGLESMKKEQAPEKP